MANETGLTPEEQRFFETGQLDLPANPDAPANPVDLAALGNSPQPQEPTVVPPVVVPPAVTLPVEPSIDMAEILRRNLAEAQQRVAELETQMRTTQKPADPDPGPDPTTDPLGALMHRLEGLQSEIKGMQTNMTQAQSQRQQLEAFQAFQANVNQLKSDFTKTAPDFDAAYAHVRNARIADLKTFGLNEKQINETLFREEVALAESAIQNGKNPASVVYEMAKRHGYAAQAATSTPQAPAAKLDAIAAAQAAAKPLASQHNSEPEFTMDGLKAASDADLNRMIMDPKLWGKIAGSTEYPL